MDLSLNHLLDYTAWQRKRWHDSLNGFVGDFQDFLGSPVMGGGLKIE